MSLSILTQYLPQHPGLLPQWLALTAFIAIGNAVQAYVTLSYTRRVYLGPKAAKDGRSTPDATSPATPLSSRTWGTWTLLQGVVRGYAAYDISNPVMYQLAVITYIIAGWHFLSEWFIFKTARLGEGILAPVLVAVTSLIWMLCQWNYYLQ
ncbi:putative ERG28 [Coleophoma cylindrospora]|uniref:Putative ERG28 n=1 Tax=Coleophoma cylindrospora TaxID=1849047 RepID=A0A3D8Q8L4_9HELO|nr:putative ERG28 [Coleophoma cylindrospora]